MYKPQYKCYQEVPSKWSNIKMDGPFQFPYFKLKVYPTHRTNILEDEAHYLAQKLTPKLKRIAFS